MQLWVLFGWLTSACVGAEPALRFNTTAKAPLNTPDRTGFLDLVCAEALRRSGYRLEVVAHPAERGLKNVNSGVDDAEMTRVSGLDAAYPNIVQVPESIFTWRFVVFSKSDIRLDDGWSSLEGKSVAYLNGWKILEKNVPASTHAVKVRNPEQLFALLAKGRVEAIIYEYWAGMNFLRQPAFAAIKAQRPALMVENMYMYLHRRHRELVPRLSAALSGMKQDGTYQRLFGQVLGPLKK